MYIRRYIIYIRIYIRYLYLCIYIRIYYVYFFAQSVAGSYYSCERQCLGKQLALTFSKNREAKDTAAERMID